jgi:hypothetical protein
MEKTDWKDLLGERVLVYLSPYATQAISAIVTSYEDGMVAFDDVPFFYNENTITLKIVYRSNKFPHGWTWAIDELSEPE